MCSISHHHLKDIISKTRAVTLIFYLSCASYVTYHILILCALLFDTVWEIYHP
jgi:hypothetical protein